MKKGITRIYAGLLALLITSGSGLPALASAVTFTGATSTDLTVGSNWSSGSYPSSADYAVINTTADLTSSTMNNILAIHVGNSGTGVLNVFSGGDLTATANSSWDSHVGAGSGNSGTVNQSGGSVDINYVEIGRGGTGTYNLTGGELIVSRGGSGNSIYLGTDDTKSINNGDGILEISGGSLVTRTGVHLGSSNGSGVGTFSVQGSTATTIGIGSSGSIDGSWTQNADSTLKVGIDPLGVTKILIDEVDGTSQFVTFESGSLLDVDYYSGGAGGGTWTVMELENGDILDNGLAFSSGVDTNIWSFNIDNSGANGLLTVTATGTPVIVTNVTVSSVAQLRQYAGLDNLTLTMTPGIYWMEGAADPIFLHLTGNNCTYNFTGVHIKVQTAELPGYGNSADVHILRLSGNGSTVDGLTLSMVKDPDNGLIDAFGNPREYSADKGMTVVLVSGSDTTIKNCDFTTGGSYPYGYSDAFGKGARPNNGGVTDSAWIAHDKQSGFLITYGATNIVVENVILNMRSYGHGFFMQGGASDILFKDCQVLGDTMADSDDIIAHPEYQAWGHATYKQPIPADINISKHEDAFRTYNNSDYMNNGWPEQISNVTITNCRAERMRNATPVHALGYSRMYDTEVYECEMGLTANSLGETTILNCKGSALNGPLVYFQYSVIQPATVEAELTGSTPGKGVWPIALISGAGNQVTITSSALPGVYPEGAYVNASQKWREWRHNPADDIDALASGNYGAATTGNFITNLTDQILVFGPNATDNTGCVSTGGVINKGSNNEYIGETLVPGSIVVSDTWSPPAYTVFSGLMYVDDADALGGSPAGDGGTTVSNGTIEVASGFALQGEDVVLYGAGTSGQGAVYSDGSPDNQTRLSSGSGSITLAGDTSVGVGTSGNQLLVGPISGSGNLTKIGAGQLTMEGGGNSFSGVFDIQEGWVLARANKAKNDLTIASGAGLSQNANLALSQGVDKSTILDGTLNINGRGVADSNALSANIGSLTGSSSGVITSTSTAVKQTVNVNSSTADSIFSGSIQGRVSLVKNGSGTTLTLSGSSTHTEDTIVNAGTLNLTGSIGSGSAVIVNSGTVLTGNGTASGAVTLNASAELSAGPDVDGLTLGSVSLAGGSSIAVEMDNAAGTAGGTGWDLVSVSGALSDGGGTGSITVRLSGLNGSVANFDSSQSYTWPIVQAASGGSSLSSATFAVDASGFTGSNPLGGGSLSVQVSGDDINLVFTPPNQPPVFSSDPINEVNADEGVAYSSTIANNASDPESDPLTFSKVSGPTWLSVASNGDLSGTPSAGDVGLNSFTVQVDATGGSDTATLEITVDAAGGPVADYAQSEATSQGSITGGSIVDTVSNDDVYEVLTEEQSGGNPNNRRSMLEHTWTFNVTGGELVTFYVEAHHDANSEGDDFTFSFSTDNVNFTDMVTVTKTADDNTAQFYSLPGSLSGTVYVKVVDTDRTQGNSATDSLFVDALFITSEAASVPPTAASNPDPADSATGVSTAPALSWTAGTLAASHDVYFGTSPTPVFIGNQSGTSYSPGTLATSTTYYWAVDEVNGAGTTIGPVWSFTTGAGTPEMHVSSIVLGTQKAGKNYKGNATVTIVDSSTGQPIQGAVVSGDFTGAFGESGSATTSSSGLAVITTGAKIPLPFTFTFTVTDVTLTGYDYNPANNVETSDSGSF